MQVRVPGEAFCDGVSDEAVVLGCAQTTLMDVIAGRKTQGEIRGDILVNGFPKEQKSWARVIGYVEQNDIHTPQVDSVLVSSQIGLKAFLPRHPLPSQSFTLASAQIESY